MDDEAEEGEERRRQHADEDEAVETMPPHSIAPS
jgi:hypothetical protein